MAQPVITITPADLAVAFLWVCGAIITVSSAAAVIFRAINKVREPEQKQNKRIDELENRIKENERSIKDLEVQQQAKMQEYAAKYELRFEAEEKRLQRLEESTEATNEALLALLGHAVNDNSEQDIRDARKKLESVLIRQANKVHI